MGGKGSGVHSQSLKAKRAEECLQYAESTVLDILTGKYKIPKSELAKLAFQLYLKRIPTMTEEVGATNSQTIINILRDYVPKGTEKQPEQVIEDRAP